GTAVSLPPSSIEEQERAQPANIVVHQLPAIIESRPENGIPLVVLRERSLLNHQRSGHPRLNDQAALPQIEHGVLGSPKDSAHSRPGQLSEQAPAADAPEHVGVTEGNAIEAAAEQGGTDVTDDGFDFGELG